MIRKCSLVKIKGNLSDKDLSICNLMNEVERYSKRMHIKSEMRVEPSVRRNKYTSFIKTHSLASIRERRHC
jgi:hypothetical protein